MRRNLLILAALAGIGFVPTAADVGDGIYSVSEHAGHLTEAGIELLAGWYAFLPTERSAAK